VRRRNPQKPSRQAVTDSLLDSRTPNVNFAVGLGLGVAVIVEKSTPGALELPAGTRAFVRVDDAGLVFTPRVRNDDVQV
jgi:hypothetical protein